MTINLDTLRTAVENAGEAWADGEHIDIITPPVVLALLPRLEQAEQQVARVREFSRTMLVPHGQGVVVAARVKEALGRALDGDTRRLADDALTARTTKNGDNK